MRQEVEADPQAPTGLWDFALRSAAKITMKSLCRVPIAGEAASYLDSWLRHLLNGKFGDFSAQTSFVIAGR